MGSINFIPRQTLITSSWLNEVDEAIYGVKSFGAIGDGVTDDTAAIQAAIDKAELTGGIVFFPRGTYLTSAELVVDKPGVSLRGEGTGTTWDGLENASSRILGSHASGAVLRIKWEDCSVEDLVIDANSTRKAAARNTTASGYNAGIRVEADDVAAPEGDVFATVLRKVYVRNQPNDGIILVGRCYGSLLDSCAAYGNYGHGICIDAGKRTSRTNEVVPGLVTIINGHSTHNYGHGLAVGNPNDDSSVLLPSFRVLLINFETNNNECDSALRYENFDVYLRGDNNRAINCAFSGTNIAGTVQSHGGLVVAGREPVIESCRYLNCTQPARVRNYSAPSVATTGAFFNRMSVRSSSILNAVAIDSGATYTKVLIQDSTSITNATDTSNTGDDIQMSDTRKVHGTLNYSDFKSGRDLTINDDAVATLEFSGTCYGLLAINGPTSASRPSLIAFRVGSSNYCTVLAGAAVASTGILTGTTGVDTNLNINTHTDNKIYIENRTGAQRVYNVTLLSMHDGRLLAGQ